MEEKPATNKNRALMCLSLLLLTDIALFLLHLNNYYLRPLFKPPEFFLLLYNVVFFVIILILLKRIYTLIISGFFLAIFLLFALIYYSLSEYKYEYFQSPKETQTLIVKYSMVSMGEYSYTYEFYKKSLFGLLMKKMKGQEYQDQILNFEDYQTAEQVLGMDDPEWLSEKEIIFHTLAGDKKIKIK